MSFNTKKLQPRLGLEDEMDFYVFDNVKYSVERKSLRKRECYKCASFIEKNDRYISHGFNYDKQLITVSFCKECYCG